MVAPPNPVVAGLAAPKRVLPPALALLFPKPPVLVFEAPPKGDDVAALFAPKPPDVAPPPKRPPPVAGAGAPKAGLLAAPKGDDVAAPLLDAPKPEKITVVSKRTKEAQKFRRQGCKTQDNKLQRSWAGY